MTPILPVGGYHEEAVSFRFVCGVCHSPADMIQRDADQHIDEVVCTVCPNAVSGDAHEMLVALRDRYRLQKTRQISRAGLAQAGLGSMPVGSVTNELSDPRWPFVLVAEPEPLHD